MACCFSGNDSEARKASSFRRRHAGDIGNRAPADGNRQRQPVEPCAAAGAARGFATELREVLAPGIIFFCVRRFVKQIDEARKPSAAMKKRLQAGSGKLLPAVCQDRCQPGLNTVKNFFPEMPVNVC